MGKIGEPNRRAIGKKIQRLRKSEGYTQESFAEKLRISRTHVGHVEQGRKSASLGLLGRIAAALKIPLQELFSK